MDKLSWHNLVVRLGRLAPPIARLHDDRNALAAKLTTAEAAVAAYNRENALTVKLASLEAVIGSLRDHAQAQTVKLAKFEQALTGRVEVDPAKREQGFIVEFEYPYAPRVRSWDGMPGGNVYRRIVESGADRYRELLSSFLAYSGAFTAISAHKSQTTTDNLIGSIPGCRCSTRSVSAAS